MAKAKLRACPFCGKSSATVAMFWNGMDYFVKCNCSASGPKSRHEYYAVRRWNCRAKRVYGVDVVPKLRPRRAKCPTSL